MESKNLLPPFLLREILTISPFPVNPPPPMVYRMNAALKGLPFITNKDKEKVCNLKTFG